MNNEYEILSHLEKNNDLSQRQIANRTGLSVGTVNLLLLAQNPTRLKDEDVFAALAAVLPNFKSYRQVQAV